MIQDLPKGLVEAAKTHLEDYEEFFKAALKKFGVDSPADFKSDEEKKKFFDYVDKNYKGEKDESCGDDHDKKEVKEGFFMKEYEPGQFKPGDEMVFVKIIQKFGGKNLDIEKPSGRNPQLAIEFDGGNIASMQKEIRKVGDGTEEIEESAFTEEKVECPKCEGAGCDHCEGKGYHVEWISADGTRRRVSEGDKRKYKK